MAGNYKIKIEPILDTAKLNKQLNETKQLKLSGTGQTAGNSFASGFGKAIKERFKYSIANALIYGTQNAVKDMVANVRELDKAQTELKKVSDLSGKSLEKFTEQAYQASNGVAKTGTEIVQAATEFTKQGFSDPKVALQLSTIASQFQNIADTEIDAATAAKFINSQLKAFGNTKGFKELNGEAEKATKVIDAVNEVANNFGVGTNDLQSALTKTSAAMKGYGNSYSETIGLITAGTELMPNQASKVARGWRSIGANIVKLAQDTDTLEAANGRINVSLKDENGNLKSTYEILKDLYPQWQKLDAETDATERSALALALSGKTQTEVFQSTMDNFQHAIEAEKAAQESAGSAAKENERYLDSIEGKLANFQSAWEQLSYHVVNSDFIKNVIDLGTELVKVLDNVVQKVGTLPTLLGMAATAFGAWKLAEQTSKLLGFASAAEKVAEGVAEASTAASAASGVGGLGGLTKVIGFLTNPAVIGGIVALSAVIGAIAWDKYFSFDSSLKRLQEYSDELEVVTQQIEELKKKRESDGLTSAEKTHLAVLEAEERSLERQIELENQRIKKAFERDAGSHGHMEQGEYIEDSSGPKQLSAYEESLARQITQYEKIETLTANIARWQSAKDAGFITPEESRLLDMADEQLQDAYDELTKINAQTAEAGSDLAKYYQEVKDAVPYDEMSADAQKAFDAMHRGFIQNQVDADNLDENFSTVSKTLSNLLGGFSGKSLDIFDDIDISGLKNSEDIINKLTQKISKLNDDAEISFTATDKTGNVIGQIEGKAGDLTKKEWKMILEAQATGDWSKVEEYANSDKASKDFTSIVKVEADAGEAEGKKKEVAEPVTTDVKFNPTNTGAVEGYRRTFGTSITTYVNYRIGTVPSIPKFAKGKRKGEGGLAWLGDEGTVNNPKPELVVGEDGAYLAGTRGWELRTVKASDTVYSYAETKKLLNGKQNFLGSVGELPMYKKGKKTKKEKKREEYDKKLEQLEHKRKVNHWTDKKFRKEYKKLYSKYKKWLSRDQKYAYSEQREDYQNERDTDKFKAKAENIVTKSDLDKYIQSVKKNKNLSATEKNELIKDARHDYYSDKLKNNANNITSYSDLKKYIQSVNKNKNLSKQEKQDLVQNAGASYYNNEFNRRLGNLSVRGADNKNGRGTRLQDFLADVRKNKYLTEQEKVEYAKQAYEAVAQYNLKAYKNGVKTREETLKSIRDYYKEVGKVDENYYKMLDELREADRQKEIDRLNQLKETSENRLTLAKKYIQKDLDNINKQIEAEKEEAEQKEKLVELEKELTQAKATKVKVYREGVGFVYEQDVEAVEKAEKALSDYQKSLVKTPLEEQKEALEAILDLFSELENSQAIKDLEVLLGVSSLASLTGGNFGTNTDLWTQWIKGELATSSGTSSLIEFLNGLDTTQLDTWLGNVLTGNGQLDSSVIESYINQHSFATGTLSAPGGLSRVAERFGGELVWLGKGDSVYSNAISRNLMEWGRYNPAQVIHSSQSSGSQVFNFDQIVLPNVYNANDFYRELQNLPNKALQQSARRA